MAITALTNQSASAPALTGQAGSLVSVLTYCLVTTLGWTLVSGSTSTVAAYRSPSGTNQFYLRVDDSGTTTARVRMYETLTDVATPTGTNPTPSDSQVSGGLYWCKSTSANSTQRPWAFYSDGKAFILLTGCASTTPASWETATSNQTYAYVFGDFPSFKSGDAYNTAIIGDTASLSTSGFSVISTNVTSAATGHYLMRQHTQLSTGVGASKVADIAGAGTMSTFGAGAIAYPAPITGGIEIARAFFGESAGRRGRVPGVWCWQHVNTASLNPFDTFSGATGTELAGRTFVFHRAQNLVCFAIETSDTWST